MWKRTHCGTRERTMQRLTIDAGDTWIHSSIFHIQKYSFFQYTCDGIGLETEQHKKKVSYKRKCNFQCFGWWARPETVLLCTIDGSKQVFDLYSGFNASQHLSLREFADSHMRAIEAQREMPRDLPQSDGILQECNGNWVSEQSHSEIDVPSPNQTHLKT